MDRMRSHQAEAKARRQEIIKRDPCQDAARARRYEQERGSSTARGYGSRWQKYRAAFLRRHPLCKICESKGAVTPASVVDHITPHKQDWKIFWDKSNHQALCASCHNRKTAREDGGFGRSLRIG